MHSRGTGSGDSRFGQATLDLASSGRRPGPCGPGGAGSRCTPGTTLRLRGKAGVCKQLAGGGRAPRSPCRGGAACGQEPGAIGRRVVSRGRSGPTHGGSASPFPQAPLTGRVHAAAHRRPLHVPLRLSPQPPAQLSASPGVRPSSQDPRPLAFRAVRQPGRVWLGLLPGALPAHLHGAGRAGGWGAPPASSDWVGCRAPGLTE